MDSAEVLKLADAVAGWNGEASQALRAYASVKAAVEAAPETPEAVAERCWHEGGREVIANAIRAAAARSLASEAGLREALERIAQGTMGAGRCADIAESALKATEGQPAALNAPSGAASGPVQEVDSDRCERCGTTAGPLLEPMLCVSCLAAPAASPAPNVAPLDWGGLCKKCGRNTEPVPEEIRNETRLAGHKWWCPACGYPVGCYYYDNPASPAPSADSHEGVGPAALHCRGCRGFIGGSLGQECRGLAALQPKATAARRVCPACGGTGRSIGVLCARCGGDKTIAAAQTETEKP